MSTVPNPTDFVAGTVASEADLDSLSLGIKFLTGTISNRVPLFYARQTVTQSLTDSTYGAITYTTEDIDTDSGHDTGSNTSRYTCQTAGKYLFVGRVIFGANATGIRGSAFALNGTRINGSGSLGPSAGAAFGTTSTTFTIVALSVSDYVELQGYQSSGGSLSTLSSSEFQSSMFGMWLGA